MENKPGDLEGLADATGKAVERESATTAAQIPPPTAAVADAPDPDEDDLDDLDGQCLNDIL